MYLCLYFDGVAHRGSSFFSGMSLCKDCNHLIDSRSHDLCRSHSFCAQGPQYFAAYCPICVDLWTRAQDYESNPADAYSAYELLRKWIYGFARNSRNRAKGQDYFADQEERDEFRRLTRVFSRAPSAPPRDRRSSSPASHRVSVCLSILLVSLLLTKFFLVIFMKSLSWTLFLLFDFGECLIVCDSSFSEVFIMG